MTVLAAGQLIARRYELTNRIAIGGMGEVWEAADTRLGRAVAVKILRPELSGDDEFRHRFRVEAQTVASLDHVGIAHVHDYGEEVDGGRRTAYLVMELVRGEPLSTIVARGALRPDDTLRVVEQAAWALHAAHERGYVHRDVKPGNILVGEDGRVKLTDFGIAKAANAAPVTRSGMVMGTAHYIAPEQATGGEAGPTGDVYSLGIVAYECLAGHRPFRGESAVDVAAMQVRDAPPPLPPAIPPNVRALVEYVLVKDPAQRYRTGREFAEAVAAVRRGETAPRPSGVFDVVEDGGTGQGAAHRATRRAADGQAPATPPRSPQTGSPVQPPYPVAQRLAGDSGGYPATASGAHRAAPPGERSGPYGRQAPGTRRADGAEPGTRPSEGSGAHRAANPAHPALRTPPPSRRTPGARRAEARTPPAERRRGGRNAPLELRSRSSAGRIFLLVLFVLLTLAAVVVGGLLLLRGPGGGGLFGMAADTTPIHPAAAVAAGSVTSREDILAGRAAYGVPLVVTVERRDAR